MSGVQEQWRALGVWGPWSGALVDGFKPLENREWQRSPSLRAVARRLRGQQLVIHESKRWQADAVPFIRSLCGHEYRRDEAHPGHLIGVVTVVDLVEMHPSPWYARGQMALVVEKGMRFAEPIPHLGRQGFMVLDEAQVKRVRAQLGQQARAVLQ